MMTISHPKQVCTTQCKMSRREVNYLWVQGKKYTETLQLYFLVNFPINLKMFYIIKCTHTILKGK